MSSINDTSNQAQTNSISRTENHNATPNFLAPVPVFGEDGEITVVSTPEHRLIPLGNPTSESSVKAAVHSETSLAVVTARTPPTTAIVVHEDKENKNKTRNHTKKELKAISATRGAPHQTYPREVQKMKIRRKQTTVALGVAGGLVGLIALGPLGAVAGGAGAAAVTRTVGKRRERKQRDRIAEQNIAEQLHKAPQQVMVHAGTLS